MIEAECLLKRAFSLQRFGPYQIEAAIRSTHVDGVRSGRPNHAALVALYDGLVALSPTLGAHVGRAAALIDLRGGAAALAAIEALPSDATRDYQPAWAVRAEALRALGEFEEAARAYERAIGATEDAATQGHRAMRTQVPPPVESGPRLRRVRPHLPCG